MKKETERNRMNENSAGRLAGKVAIVTGAALGMGRAEAILFASEGATVFVADILDSAGQALAATHRNIHYIHLDVADEWQWVAQVKLVLEKAGKIDILVNNAALQWIALLEETTTEKYEQLIRVNQFGPFFGMRAVIPTMKSAKTGSIVNVSSIAGLGGLRGMTAYVASKFAVRGMTKVAALELGKYNVRVNSIHPGLVDTPMTQRDGNEKLLEWGRATPFGRAGRPEEVAELALFLASDASSFCSGGEYACDGAASAVAREAFTV
jgi:3alpha(or 20beta)-hydroxysteroid dehydrogenase